MELGNSYYMHDGQLAKEAMVIGLLDFGCVVIPRLDGFTWLCGPHAEGIDAVILRH